MFIPKFAIIIIIIITDSLPTDDHKLKFCTTNQSVSFVQEILSVLLDTPSEHTNPP
jgi:hypothetical protein